MTKSDKAKAVSTAARPVAAMIDSVAERKAIDETVPVESIASIYSADVSSNMTDYLDNGDEREHGDKMKAAILALFAAAFWRGYSDGAGNADKDDSAALAWIVAATAAEVGYIAALFGALKDIRAEVAAGNMTLEEARVFVAARSAAYTVGLMSVYNAGLLFGLKDKMLMWNIGSTREHCSSCTGLSGVYHRSKWYIANNMIPRRPGANLECGGYQCKCYLTDREGNRVTL